MTPGEPDWDIEDLFLHSFSNNLIILIFTNQQPNLWYSKVSIVRPGRYRHLEFEGKIALHSSPDVGQNKIFENGLCGLDPLIYI